MPRPPTAVITVRSAVAVRPPRPITLPRSSGCTRICRVRPRRPVDQLDADVVLVVDDAPDQVLQGVLEHAHDASAALGRSRRPARRRLGGGGCGCLGGVGAGAAFFFGVVADGPSSPPTEAIAASYSARLSAFGRLPRSVPSAPGRPLNFCQSPVTLSSDEHGLGRLRADAEPVLRPVGVDLDDARVGLRVVLADVLDRPAAAAGAGVGDDDAVERLADLAETGELDLDSHGGGASPCGLWAGGRDIRVGQRIQTHQWRPRPERGAGRQP